jgi:hypothetical protein
MKALTLTQPWATLVAIGAKRIETRSFRVSYRGPLAIHAAKGFPNGARAQCLFEPFVSALRPHCATLGDIPRGVVLATCNLVDCLPMEAEVCLSGVFDDYPNLDTPQERAFGNYSEGRWAWILEDVQRLDQPVPAKGALGLWEWARP